MARDQRREQWLDRQSVKWEYRAKVLLTQVSMDKIGFSQIRCLSGGKLDADNLHELSTTLANGVDLPAPVLFEINDEDNPEIKFGIINGAHTVESKIGLGRGFSDAYMIMNLLDPNLIDQLRRHSNSIESVIGFRIAERAEEGLWLVDKDGITAKAAAEKLGIKVGLISIRKRAREVRDELLESGVPAEIIDNIPVTGLAGLNVIRNPAIRSEVVLLAHEAKMPAGEAQLFYRETADAKTETSAKAVIARWRSRLEDRIRSRSQGRSSFNKVGIVDRYFRNMEKELKAKKLPININFLIESLEGLIRLANGLLKDLRRIKEANPVTNPSKSKVRSTGNGTKRSVANSREARPN